MNFDFDYSPVSMHLKFPITAHILTTCLRPTSSQQTRACRWSVISDPVLHLSLVFVFEEDYMTMKAAVGDVAQAGAPASVNRRLRVTHVASMTSRASSSLNELFRRLEVNCLPKIEECVAT